MDLQEIVRSRGGLAATHELLRAGATSRLLTRAVRSDVLIRVRQGWYGLPSADTDLEAAVRVGGRATCVTAAESYGMWVVRTPVIHVEVPENESRLRSPRDRRVRLRGDDPVRVHWRPPREGDRHRLTPEGTLLDMIGCQRLERVVAAVDGAIRNGMLSRRRWFELVRGCPVRLRELLREADGVPESWLESIAGFRLRRAGYRLRRQVRIPGIGRVDMMIGDRLIIEFDGWDFHRTREAFERDRRRDAELARRGYTVLRFTHRHVIREWRRVLTTIDDCLSRG